MIQKTHIETAVRAGHPVDVSADNAAETVGYLQDLASMWLDAHQNVYAIVALLEAERICKQFPDRM